MPQDTPEGRAEGDRIDVNQDEAVRAWAKTFDASPQQIREAVEAVGDRADEVEAYLKGTRSSVNSERVRRASERPS